MAVQAVAGREVADRVSLTPERPRRALLATLRSSAASTTSRVRSALGPPLSAVTPLGWSVLTLGVLAWIAGAVLGWQEMQLVAATCLLALAMAACFLVGPTSLRIDVDLDPRRLVAGGRAVGRVRFTNRSGRRTLAVDVDLPVGEAVAAFHAPTLAAGAAADELFVIPTERRGVIVIGPATTVRGDPVGMLRRRAPGGGATELIVHPRTVPIPSFGAGVLRDLEGLTTKEVSASDLAFHSLREYAPGDDQRMVHWRSTAKTGRLQVRQFNDTRRSSLTVIVDASPAAYADAEEFETALEVAGSLALRASRDGLQALILAGDQLAIASVPYLLLDALARAQLAPAGQSLALAAAKAAQRGTSTTLAVIVSGSAAPASEMRRAALRFASEVRTVAIRIVPGESWTAGSAGLTTIIQLGELTQLPAVVTSGAVA
ncbi:MAG: DUF58 domain-containing protein [Candidatus Dormibacteria bacterium]